MTNKTMLAILGSPHKNGMSALMLNYAMDLAKQSGWNIKKIDLYEEKLAFCTGCRVCLKTKECVINDIHNIASIVKESDAIVLATPVYWANVPAIVKNLFDRLLGTAMEETKTFPKPLLSGKKYLFLSSCHTAFPASYIFGQSRGANRAVKEFFKTAGISCSGTITIANTGKKKNMSHSDKRKINKGINKLG